MFVRGTNMSRSGKRTRLELTQEQKIQLNERFDAIPRPTQIASKHQIAKQTVYDFVKKRDHYQSKSEKNITSQSTKNNSLAYECFLENDKSCRSENMYAN